MLGDQMAEIITRPTNRILGKQQSKRSLINFQNSKTNLVLLPKSPLDITRSSRHSQTSKASRTTRKVQLNNRGIKMDALSMKQLSKDYNQYGTTYEQDFASGAPKEIFFHQKNISQPAVIASQSEIPPKSDDRLKFPQEQEKLQPTSIQSIPAISISSSQSSNILEQISPTDPIWSLIIPENLLKDPNVNIEKLVEDNYDYFSNLIGLVMKERTQKDFSFNQLYIPMQSRQKTSYAWNFKNFEGKFNRPPILTTACYETYNKSQSVGFKTTYNQFFTPQQFQDTQSCKPKEEIPDRGTTNLTSYRQDFFNWKPGKAEKMGYVYNISTGNLPFIGKSRYKEEFVPVEINPAQPEPKKKIGPFAQGSELIFTNSYNQDTFKPFSVKHSRSIEKVDNTKQSVEQIKTFEGQFKTQVQKDYTKHQVDEESLNLNNQRVWQKRLIKKLEEIRNIQKVQ